MRTVLTALLLGVFSIVSAQEDPGSAVSIVLENHLVNTDAGTCSLYSGALGASGSGEATCTGTDTDDAWLTFSATTQAAKFSVNSNDADLVIQVLDNALNSVDCTNGVAGVGEEVMYVTTLTPGDNYYLRIHSVAGGGGTYSVCSEYMPAAKIRDGWFPAFTPDIGLPGYRINQTINRDFYTPYSDQIQASMWEFTDVNTGDVYTYTLNTSFSQINLNVVGGLCFNSTYDVRVQVQVDGVWCGYGEVRQIFTESVPTTELEPGYGGQTYALNGEMKARFVGAGQELEWRLTTDNGLTSFTHNGGFSSWLYLEEIECIRHNKVYTVEVRANYCGIWGPWSAPDFFITTPVPYTLLETPYCGQEYFQGSFLEADFLPVVDQYAWQFAPIEPGDATLTPIGPAIVAYSEQTPLLSLMGLGLEPGGHYRVGVKPMLGYFDSCNDQQEGDYGFFCEISIFDPGAFGPDPTEAPVYSFAQNGLEVNVLTAYPNPVQNEVLSLRLPHGMFSGVAQFTLLAADGRMVMQESVQQVEDAQVVQFTLPGDLPAGNYFATLVTSEHSESVQVIVK